MLRAIRRDAGCDRVTHPAQLLQCYTEGQRDFQSARLPGADLWYADLAGVNLRGADLRGADLRYANLRDANLEYACLDHADLWEAELQGANLRGVSLDQAQIWGAFYDDTTLFDPELQPEHKGLQLRD